MRFANRSGTVLAFDFLAGMEQSLVVGDGLSHLLRRDDDHAIRGIHRRIEVVEHDTGIEIHAVIDRGSTGRSDPIGCSLGRKQKRVVIDVVTQSIGGRASPIFSYM